jgi:hypothetical protein
MTRPTFLLAVLLSAVFCYGQKTDTLVLFYKSDQFNFSKADKQRLDSFIVQGWDRITINGYTDETDGEDYNLELSKKRSRKVYEFFTAKSIPENTISYQYFGESMPRADNGSDDGRALNRRTEIIGYRFARMAIKPVIDPMKPVMQTLDNGIIITYRPGGLSGYMRANFQAGSGMNFQVLTNTVQMQANNLYNNTTNGEILSSVVILCADQIDPCRLDSPVTVRVPVPFKTSCPIQNVKFFNAVMRNGRRIWKEENKPVYPEVINGKTYMRVSVDSFCGCINFDFKVDPECYDIDSAQIQYLTKNIRSLTVELRGLNSVYLPSQINDSTYRFIFLKDRLNQAPVSFALYNGKRRIRSFREQSLAAFPYDELSGKYVLSTGTLKFYFHGLKVTNVVLKVNNDKYRVEPENNNYEFVYLNRKKEVILVDFSIMEKRREIYFRDQPLESFPLDEATGSRVIDRKFLKELRLRQSVTLGK